MRIPLAEDFGKAFIPERFRPRIRQYFVKAGFYELPYQWFGVLFYISVIISGVSYSFLWDYLKRLSPVTLMVYTFVLFFIIELAFACIMMGFIYLFIDVKIYKRTKEIEKVLPDFLNVVGENLKTGMPIDQALWHAVKPEFGILASEIRVTAKKVATGQDVGDALKDFANKYDSPNVKRSFLLLVESLKGGGEIADIIDKSVEDIRQTNVLKESLSVNAISFVIFITIIVIVISPGLFALAYVLLTILKGFAAQIGEAGVSSAMSFFSFKDISVDLDEFKLFSQLAIGTIALFAAMIISTIYKGDIRSGLKYIPLFITAALIVYTIAFKVLLAVFGGLFG